MFPHIFKKRKTRNKSEINHFAKYSGSRNAGPGYYELSFYPKYLHLEGYGTVPYPWGSLEAIVSYDITKPLLRLAVINLLTRPGMRMGGWKPR